MRLNIDVTMDYQLSGDDAVLLILEAAQSDSQSVFEGVLDIDGGSLRRIDGEGMVGQRTWAFVTNDRLKLRYRAKVDVSRPLVVLDNLAATPLRDLPGDVVSYLRPSRFCQSDLFMTFVKKNFGHLGGGAKIAAIMNWVTAEMSYVSGSSHGATTAMDTFVAREGVCRDFVHLVCSMARAAFIPARYTSAYGLGVSPPDFHAVAEIWLDGAWHLVDPTGMSTADTMVIIGSGRDAADVAFMETEQWATMLSQNVSVSQA